MPPESLERDLTPLEGDSNMAFYQLDNNFAETKINT